MARVTYQARLTQMVHLTPTVRELTIAFETPKELTFRAGQFVMLHVPGAQEKPLKRAYSIASSDRNHSQIKLIIKLVPGGAASEYIRPLQDGTKLELSGPFGKLFFNEPPTQQVFFICTGAGISQHHAFLTSVCPHYPDQHYHCLFGVWNEDEIFYQRELQQIQATLPHFDFDYVLDHTLKGSWTGKTGYVTDHLHTFGDIEKNATFYLCGNPAMIKGVKALLSAQGVPKSSIFAEAFH